MLALNAASPSQYFFLQNNNRCTRAKCTLLCKYFLLLTLSKFLSKEFLAGNSLIKKSHKNSSEIQEMITEQSVTEKALWNVFRQILWGGSSLLENWFVQGLVLNESHLLINFVKNELFYQWFLRTLRLFMEALTRHNMALLLSCYSYLHW